MKNTRSLIAGLALAAALAFSCKQMHEEKSATEAVSSEPANTVSSSAAVEKKGEKRKFIRTADLRFKAKSVAKTTYAIENITTKMGGFVTYTNLRSETNSEETSKINTDSSVVTKRFTVINDMVLRVPNTKLDSTLKAITPLIDHLDVRVIKADDVSLKMLSNQMAQSRSSENTKRLENAIDGKGKKLNDITNAEEALAAKKEAGDQSKIDNLSLKDQVDFSTVNIAMYQRESVSREMVANIDNDKYVQDFGSRMSGSLENGWKIITAILVFLTNLWPFLLIGILIIITLKRYKRA